MIEWKGERLYTVKEVAGVFHRSVGQIHDWIKKGKLPARLIGGVRYVAEKEIDRVIGVQEISGVRLVTTKELEQEAAKHTTAMRNRGAI